MNVYIDTSALVKLYTDEPGSRETRDVVRQASRRGTSLIAYVEVMSAFSRKFRARRVSERFLAGIKAKFERDWDDLHRMPVDSTIVIRAGEFTQSFSLKAYDAIHLASAELLHSSSRSTRFACFDRELNQAAAQLGLEVIFG